MAPPAASTKVAVHRRKEGALGVTPVSIKPPHGAGAPPPRALPRAAVLLASRASVAVRAAQDVARPRPVSASGRGAPRALRTASRAPGAASLAYKLAAAGNAAAGGTVAPPARPRAAAAPAARVIKKAAAPEEAGAVEGPGRAPSAGAGDPTDGAGPGVGAKEARVRERVVPRLKIDRRLGRGAESTASKRAPTRPSARGYTANRDAATRYAGAHVRI